MKINTDYLDQPEPDEGFDGGVDAEIMLEGDIPGHIKTSPLVVKFIHDSVVEHTTEELVQLCNDAGVTHLPVTRFAMRQLARAQLAEGTTELQTRPMAFHLMTIFM